MDQITLKIGSIQEYKLRGTPAFIRYHTEINIGPSSRNGLMLGGGAVAFRSESKMKNQFEDYRQSNSYRKLFGIDGEPIEFEWNIFPGLASLEILQKIRKDLKDQNLQPENFEGRIIFMSMFSDIGWTKRGHPEKMYFKFRASHELSGEILTRTPDIPRPRRRKEIVRNSQLHTCRKMGFHRHTYGGTLQRNWSPNIQKHQCVESWHSEQKRLQRYLSPRCGFIEHRTLVSHNSLSKSAQYLRSSLKLDRCEPEKILNPLREFSQVFDKNKDDRIP